MRNREKPQRFRGDIWFQNQVREKTKEAILQRHNSFAVEHKGDTDDQLLDYVRAFRKELGRTPNAGEIIGGPYIAMRFGGWDKVVLAANLPPPQTMPSFEKRLIYKTEYKRQEKLFRQERVEGRDSTKEQRRQKDAESRAADQERQKRDLAWGHEHESDTEAQLIAYVKECAAKLGHSPTAQEVLGATYIAQCFGSWAVVLTIAELPLPVGVKAPNPKTMKAYRERRRNSNKED